MERQSFDSQFAFIAMLKRSYTYYVNNTEFVVQTFRPQLSVAVTRGRQIHPPHYRIIHYKLQEFYNSRDNTTAEPIIAHI